MNETLRPFLFTALMAGAMIAAALGGCVSAPNNASSEAAVEPESGDAVPWIDAYRGVIGRCDEASESADYLSSCFFRKAYICRGDDKA